MALDDWQIRMAMKAFRPLLPLIKAELTGVDPKLIPITLSVDGVDYNFIEGMDIFKKLDFQRVETVRIEIKNKPAC